MSNRMLWVLALAMLSGVVAMAQSPGTDPGAPDTLYISSVQVNAGQKAVVSVNFFNDEEMAALTVPLAWSSDDITLDSLSYVGSRIAYIGTKPDSIYNNIQAVVFGAIIFFEPNIQPGNGLMVKLYFNIPPGTPDQFVYIDTTSVGPASLAFTNPNATNFVPVVRSGKITIGNPQLPPRIELSPDSMVFEGVVGFPNPSFQALSITNIGQGTLNWTAATSQPWLTVNPASGIAPTSTSVRVNIAGFTPGNYFASVTISAPGADNTPQILPVRMHIITLAPRIVVSLKSFSISGIQDGANPEDRYLFISTDVPGSQLHWTVSHSSSWLTLSPTAGAPPDSVRLRFNIAGLPYGFYYDTIVVSDPQATNNPQRVPVTLQIVSALPILAMDPPILHVVAVVGQSTLPKVVRIYNSGEGVMTYQATESSRYITGLNPSSGTAPQYMQISFATGIMALGDYYDTITVTSPEAINSPQHLIVHFHISNSPAQIALLPSSITINIFECWQGPEALPPIRTLQIENIGQDLMNWWLTHKSDWLLVSQESGRDDAILLLRLSAEVFPLGSYYDTIVVYSDEAINSPQRVPVTLNVVHATEDPLLVVQNTNPNIPAQEVFGTTNGVVAVMNVYNQNPGCMDFWVEEDIPWLRFIDSAGSAPLDPQVAVEIGSYTWGVYPDSFYVYSSTASNSPVKTHVNLLIWRLHGDFDWNNQIDLADAVKMINYIFRDGPGPEPEYAVGDCNCDVFIRLDDAIVLINYIFKNGNEPCGNP